MSAIVSPTVDPRSIKLNPDLKLPCVTDTKDPRTIVIRSPTNKDKVHDALEVLVGHSLSVTWHFDGCHEHEYRNGKFRVHVPFQFDAPLFSLPFVSNTAPITVTIKFRDHVLFEQRFT